MIEKMMMKFLHNKIYINYEIKIIRSITNSLDFSNKNPPIDPSKSPRSYKHFDPIADRIPRVVVELSSQT
ncbi:hypothetical protein BDBG_17647 [Blastomyces gilchristii SLH14081]|uniref:Uncharacterized protein n=1 Tax=Blastomyces gilchristii (strain SLH14081) TaxID=559298 RepID=A0A179UWU0_BLAGS|nr:uncharacterized protein BDBG_17647 [Blastomyces gilchristii SLH14081]OAT12283.1 hypothetical protein BDBG_17647 [Blastomyces gilchristii SLH14081]